MPSSRPSATSLDRRKTLRRCALGASVIVAGVVSAVLLFAPRHRRPLPAPPPPILSGPVGVLLRPRASVDDRLQEFGAIARKRLKPAFERAGVVYPPKTVTMVGLKKERRLEIYASDESGHSQFICQYPILAASGKPGPKLRQGDRQVPEGFYRVVFLNANSRFHVSLRLDYPNAFDQEQAAKERRTRPGGDIMIHGAQVSAGCLAMGDPVSEDLFTLAADVGTENIGVLLCPIDFRKTGIQPDISQPAWVQSLYSKLSAALRSLPSPS